MEFINYNIKNTDIDLTGEKTSIDNFIKLLFDDDFWQKTDFSKLNTCISEKYRTIFTCNKYMDSIVAYTQSFGVYDKFFPIIINHSDFIYYKFNKWIIFYLYHNNFFEKYKNNSLYEMINNIDNELFGDGF